MFISEWKRIENGTEYIYHKLLESYRNDDGKSRNRSILDLGKLELSKEEIKDLGKRITEIVEGKQKLFNEIPEKIERQANYYSRLVINKLLNNSEETEVKEKIVREEANIYIDTIENSEIRTIGAEYVGLEVFKELGLDQILKEKGFNEKEINLSALSIIGRLVKPGSEAATRRYAMEISGIDELLGADFSNISNNALYRISDKLFAHKNDIESKLRKKEKDLFSLEETIVLYDLTNTYYEGIGKNSEILSRGRSKEKRTDCPIVTLGLTLDENGFPKYSNIYKGNIGEPSTLEDVLTNLAAEDEKDIKLFGTKKTIVMDAGIVTKDNLELIKNKGYDYIVVSRNKIYSQDELIEMGVKENLIEIKEGLKATFIKEESETVVYCESEGRKQKEESMKNLFQERFEGDLTKMNNGLSKKSCTKKYEKIVEKIGRLKEKYSRISSCYEIEVKENNGKAIEIIWMLNNKVEDKFSGNYFIKTSKTDLSEKEIIEIYTMLTKVESAFRFFKSELGLRPIYHKKDTRIKGHLFITVLAYHILNVILRKLSDKGINHTWNYIREGLSTHCRVTTSMELVTGGKLHTRTTSKARLFQSEIYQALNLKENPLKMKKVYLGR